MFILGVNYWPRRSSLEMLRRGSIDEIAEDLAKVKELGFDAVRIFMLLRDVVDPDHGIVEDRVELFEKVLEKARELGLSVYPTLITVHMSGRNWFNPLSKGSVYTLETLDAMQIFLASIVSRLRSHESVKGWVLTNEISLVEQPPNPSAYRAFTRSLILTIKGVDHDRPVGLGDITFFVPGTDPESIDTIPVDFIDIHLYYYDNDDVRQSLAYSALASLYMSTGKPVIVEEFGCSTHVFDEESHARFVNAVLHSLLANNVSGAFLWCFADYVQEAEHLFEHHPYELGFGVLRNDGSEKPVASVIKHFSSLIKTLEKEGLWDGYELRGRDVAIVLTRHGWGGTTFSPNGKLAAVASALESYVLMKGASAPVTMLPEHLVGSSNHALYVLPSIVRACVSTWRSLLAKAFEGSSVYASVLRIERGAHQGPSHVWMELFGAKPKLKACRIGRAIEGVVTLEFVQDFGSIAKGTRIRLRVGDRIGEKLFAWEIEPEKAEVVATLGDGTPAVVVNSLGKSYAILSAVPIEAILASQHVVDRSSSDVKAIYDFYSALLELAGVERIFVSSDPRVELEYFLGKKDCIAIAVNHSYDDIETLIKSSSKVKNVEKIGGDAELLGVEDSSAIRLRMPGKSSAVLKIKLG
ncbi:MAG: cellulase family glycosylhydrolase [Crenarchaeota archaeon]|nr:cellulase family glycosylhydrolase [Thermoproteota archaeon]